MVKFSGKFLWKPVVFIGCLGLTLSTGFISAVATVDNVGGWYSTVRKPFFNPPNWVFAPVWCVLYVLMAISLYLVIVEPTSVKKGTSLVVFLIHLCLNFLWSIIFFYYHQIGLALIDLLLLLPCIALLIGLFKPINLIASRLLIPYILWVSFATVLNATIWWLN